MIEHELNADQIDVFFVALGSFWVILNNIFSPFLKQYSNKFHNLNDIKIFNRFGKTSKFKEEYPTVVEDIVLLQRIMYRYPCNKISYKILSDVSLSYELEISSWNKFTCVSVFCDKIDYNINCEQSEEIVVDNPVSTDITVVIFAFF